MKIKLTENPNNGNTLLIIEGENYPSIEGSLITRWYNQIIKHMDKLNLEEK